MDDSDTSRSSHHAMINQSTSSHYSSMHELVSFKLAAAQWQCMRPWTSVHWQWPQSSRDERVGSNAGRGGARPPAFKFGRDGRNTLAAKLKLLTSSIDRFSRVLGGFVVF